MVVEILDYRIFIKKSHMFK